MNVFAQIVGILAILFFAIQYILLGAFSAATTNTIGLIKNLVFYDYTKKDKNIPVLALLIYSAIIIVSGILTFNGILSVFPIILSLFYAYGVWQSNLKIYRGISVIGAIAWIIYNFAVGAYVSVIGNVIQLFSAIIAVWRLDIKKSKEEK